MRDPGQQILGRHELARNAEAALDGAGVEERLLQPGQAAVRRQPLDRDDLGAVGLGGEDQARIDDLAVKITVQAPHSPTRQHSFVPVRPRSSRSTSSSVCWAATSACRGRPFTVSRTAIVRPSASPLRPPGQCRAEHPLAQHAEHARR